MEKHKSLIFGNKMENVKGIYTRILVNTALLTLLMAFGCKKVYNPKMVSSSETFLVVEGAINTGADSTIIRLSRTVPLGSKTRSVPEAGASVSIVSNTGESYQLIETTNGFYKAPGLNLGITNKYSLRIITAGGKQYQSDFIQGKNSPPIDSVYYRIQNNGIQLYADTHDPSNSTKYYRWDFIDTYLFHTPFNSHEYFPPDIRPDTVLPRPLNEQIYACWHNDTSTNIVVNSSAKLTQDVIVQNELDFIPYNSEKIASRYSILVKQYALTPEAFNYYQQLKKKTEQLGSIFDAQPSELPGNIHCITNPAEGVIGYITAGSFASARIFIDHRDLPDWKADDPYSGCMLYTDYYAKPVAGGAIEYEVQEYIYTGIHIPVDPVSRPGSNKILGYTSSDPGCVDCTLRGANKQPAFWKNYGE